MNGYNNWRDVLKAILFALGFILLMAALGSCTTVRQVESIREVHDTLVQVSVKTDSVVIRSERIDTFLQHDSIRIIIERNEKGEVTKTDREAYYWREARSRSVEQQLQKTAETDSLKERLHELDKKKEVIKTEPPSLWDRIRLATWGFFVCVAVIETILLLLVRYATKKNH